MGKTKGSPLGPCMVCSESTPGDKQPCAMCRLEEWATVAVAVGAWLVVMAVGLVATYLVGR